MTQSELLPVLRLLLGRLPLLSFGHHFCGLGGGGRGIDLWNTSGSLQMKLERLHGAWLSYQAVGETDTRSIHSSLVYTLLVVTRRLEHLYLLWHDCQRHVRWWICSDSHELVLWNSKHSLVGCDRDWTCECISKFLNSEYIITVLASSVGPSSSSVYKWWDTPASTIAA